MTFQPGQSGNPKGREKGSRNKLGEAFIEALHSDFTQHGVAVIAAVRKEKPDQYLKVIASILPKDVNLTVNDFEGKSDDDIRRELRELASLVDALLVAEGDEGEESGARAARPN